MDTNIKKKIRKKKSNENDNGKKEFTNINNDDDVKIIDQNIVNKKSEEIQGKVLLNNTSGFNENVNIDTQMFTNNVNIRGILNLKKDLIGEESLYLLNNEDTNKYFLANNKGYVICDAIEMNNIIIGKNDIIQFQENSISIGNNNNTIDVGENNVLIGQNAGTENKINNVIHINGTGVPLDIQKKGFYVQPIEKKSDSNILFYNPTTKEVTYE